MVALRGSSGGKTSKWPTAGLKITEGLELESVQGCTLEKVFRVLNPSELRGNEIKLGRRKKAGFESECLAPVAVGCGATTVERSDRHSQLPSRSRSQIVGQLVQCPVQVEHLLAKKTKKKKSKETAG